VFCVISRLRTAHGRSVDPETASTLVDERDYLVSRRSSFGAKRADAPLRISFARRSSAFALSSCFKRARSSVVRPGQWPASDFARRTHCCSVSWLTDNFAAIDSIAFHGDRQSSW
jgi:hypothetical protein